MQCVVAKGRATKPLGSRSSWPTSSGCTSYVRGGASCSALAASTNARMRSPYTAGATKRVGGRHSMDLGDGGGERAGGVRALHMGQKERSGATAADGIGQKRGTDRRAPGGGVEGRAAHVVQVAVGDEHVLHVHGALWMEEKGCGGGGWAAA
jgi:hypothetical protein